MDLKFLLEFKGLKRIYEIEEDPEVMEDPGGSFYSLRNALAPYRIEITTGVPCLTRFI